MDQKTLLGLGLGFFLWTSQSMAVLSVEDELKFQQIVCNADRLQPDTGPHVYDAQIPAWTAQLTEIFPKIFKGPLLSYEEAKTRLLTAAKQFDEAIPNQHKTIFGNTFEQMIQARLVNPTGPLATATETLLSQAVALTRLNSISALIQSCDPLNPSASAVYNVFFKWTVIELQRELDTEKNQDLEDRFGALAFQDFSHSQETQAFHLHEDTNYDSGYDSEENDTDLQTALRVSQEIHEQEQKWRGNATFPPQNIFFHKQRIWEQALNLAKQQNPGMEFPFNPKHPDLHILSTFPEAAFISEMSRENLTRELAEYLVIVNPYL